MKVRTSEVVVAEVAAWDDENWDETSFAQGSRLALLFFPVLGFLAFELTTNPMLGVFVACLKPGLDDGRTAYWLVRKDPKKPRGWACCFMFLAAGFWKTFAWSIMLGVFLVILSKTLEGGAVMRDSLKGSLFAALFGFVILILSSALAVGSAFVSRTRVWVSRDVHRARRADVWPPSGLVRHEANNQADVLMMPMLLVLCFGLVATIILAAMAVASTKIAANAGGVIAVSVIASMIAGSALILILRDTITFRIIAGDASNCWPPDEVIAELDEFGMPRQR
jgi:hypothetical protein